MRSRPLPKIVLSTMAAGLALSACAGAPEADADAATGGTNYPVKATSCGYTSTIKATPKRAIAMNQGETEVALALGVQDRLGGTAYLDDAIPAKWKKSYDSVKVISKEYPDRETVLAAKPDFVYGSYSSAFEAKSAGTQKTLDGLGIGSFQSPFGCGENKPGTDVSFDSVWGEIHTVGEVFGVPSRADAIAKDQQEVLDELKGSSEGKDLKVFWFDSGDKTAFAGTGEGGPQLILGAVGATNVFANIKSGWADVSWEKVVAADPDVIVFADANWSTAEDKKKLLAKDPVLSKLRAVRDRQYVPIPFPESTPGVRLADGAASVSDQLAKLRANR